MPISKISQTLRRPESAEEAIQSGRMPRGRGAGRGNRTFLGRLRKAVSNAEFEILFLLFAGVFYITFKYFLYVSCSLVWLRPFL